MEIGSEFEWEASYKDNRNNNFILPYQNNGIFTFSGRTSLEQVLNSFSAKGKILLPSYCCDSIIEPCRRCGLELDFYDVDFDENNIKINIKRELMKRVGILFISNYFGFKIKYPETIINQFRNNGGVVIEDITHSLLSDYKYHEFSDYVVASLRKWGPLLDGGYCAGKIKKIKECTLKPCELFIDKKKTAMLGKSRYLHGEVFEKSCFLRLFNDANHLLSNAFSDKHISNISYDIFKKMPIEKIKEIRISNAKILYKELSEIKQLKFLFDVKNMDCPLFVPVLVSKEHRDKLRAYLIKKAYIALYIGQNLKKYYRLKYMMKNYPWFVIKDITQKIC